MSDASVRNYIYKKLKLTDVRKLVRENTGWDAAQLAAAEHWYRNFLWLAYVNRASRSAIGIETHADRFWHAHILDTEDYAKVCQAILGRKGFIHHKPVGKKAATSPQLLKRTTSAY